MRDDHRRDLAATTSTGLRAGPAADADRGNLTVIRTLMARLRDAPQVDDALVTALDVTCEGLGAAAGAAWSRDPAGQWRLVAVSGEVATTSPALHEPVPARPDQYMADIQPNVFGGADVVLPAGAPFFGAPLGALRLIGLADDHSRAGPWPLLDVLADVTSNEVRHRHEHQRLDEVAHAAGIATWEWFPPTDAVHLDRQMYGHLGTDRDRFVHTLAGYLARVHPDDRDEFERVVQAAVNEPAGSWRTVHRLIGDDGTTRWVEVRGEAISDAEGEVPRLWGTSQDVTHRERMARELAHAAEHDQLTGLRNRTAFARHVQAATEHADPGGLVVALVDIDGFKSFNEQQGWTAGDALLCEVGRHLTDLVPGFPLVARLGADEFALMLHDGAGSETLEELGERIAAGLSDRAHLPGTDQRPSIRVGIAANVDGVESGDDLWRAASMALDVVKNRASGRSQVFDAAEHGRALARVALEADLRHALEVGDVSIAYQPILTLHTGRIVGFEALARWDRPGHGPVSPATFIPLAERAGLLGHLGQQVLEGACRQLRDWDEVHPGDHEPYMAVNLASSELDEAGLIDRVQGVLDRYGLAPDRLVLEVTETALAYDVPGVLARLSELQRRGVRISIDDFGTGYSSLSRLRELPFDILKIDRSFIRGITSRHTPTPILEALFSMAQALDLDVVAEGVETPAQVAALMTHDCGFAQGFLFSRPLPPDDLTSLLGGEFSWDPVAIAAEVPAPRSSPRLHGLLNQIAEASDDPSPDAIESDLAVLAELTSLDSVYITKVNLGRGYQEILAAVNIGTLLIEAGSAIPWAETLCRRAIADGREVVPDAPTIYPDIVAATDLGIRTYVGVELHGPKGGLRGTLCGVSAATTDVPQETVETFHWIARLLGGRVRSLQRGLA